MAVEMNIFYDDFKPTWGWSRKLRHCECLNIVRLYGEGGPYIVGFFAKALGYKSMSMILGVFTIWMKQVFFY